MQTNSESSSFNLIASPRPFSTDRINVQRPAGGTIADHMKSIGMDPGPIFARVFIDDRLIPKAEWEFARPAAGQLVTVRAVPTGGQGQGKDALRIVAMIGIVAAALLAPYAVAAYAPGWGLIGSWSGAALSASVMITGTLAMHGLLPPPLPRRAVPRPLESPSRKEAA